MTDGWVVSFTEDVAEALGERSNAALTRLKSLAATPVVSFSDDAGSKRIAALCAELYEEHFLAREGYRLAMRGLLALIAIGVARLAASRARTGSVTLAPADATVEALRKLVEENFRKQRHLEFYAQTLAMTPDRLNDHVKRATGVTAGHLIRQRVLTEAKRQLVFTASRSTRSPTTWHFRIRATSRASSASRPAPRRMSSAPEAEALIPKMHRWMVPARG